MRKRLLHSLALMFALLVVISCVASTEVSICDVRCGSGRAGVVVFGSVENLRISYSAYANFDLRDSLCEVHVYWNFPGFPLSWLRDGARVEVRGEYQEYNKIYRGPEILASYVAWAFYHPIAPVAPVAPADWSVVAWGAAGEVAGSCYQLTTPSSSVLVDCGSFMNTDDMPSGSGGDTLDCDPFPFDPRTIAAVLITHAHDDHTARVHYLVAQGFWGPIYMTHATAAIYRAKLNDALYYSCLPGMRNVGDRDEMKARIEGMIVELGYLERFYVADGIYATFVDAAHIPGSASIVVDVAGPDHTETIVFSGDLGSGHHPFLRVPDTDWLSTTSASTLIIESTYGASDAREYPEDLYGQFYEAIQSELDNDRLVIIPVFALDRTQRVLSALIAGVLAGRIIPDRPIGIGGKSSYYLTLEYIKMHSQPSLYGQCFSDEFFSSDTFRGRDAMWEFVRGSLNGPSSETPDSAWDYSIVLTPSGTGSSSYAKTLIDAYGTSDAVTFFQVGWAPDTSPLGELANSGRVVNVKDVFSGHADIKGLVEYVSGFPDLERVIITHGDDPIGARQGLENAISSTLSELEIIRPVFGQEIPLYYDE